MANNGILNGAGQLNQAKLPDVNTLSSRHCIKCGSAVFLAVRQHSDWPGLVNPSGQDMIITMERLRCLQCGEMYGNAMELLKLSPAERQELIDKTAELQKQAEKEAN